MRVRGLAIRALACAIALVSPAAGLTAIAVGSNGQAAYGLPISVPPGIAGMAPNLSLSYSDGGINGPVGVGWSLQGISTVTRCGASRVIDGSSRAVDFTGADKLCLDGQRLIQTDEAGSPTAVANSKGVAVATQVNDALGLGASAIDLSVYREFRTEKDTFARIRAYGSAGGDSANGPAIIKAWTKSGQIYEYGLNPVSADSNALISALGRSAVMVWAVRRVADSLGNYIDFRYTQRDVAWGSGVELAGGPGREWNVAEIQYTGTTLSAPRNKVVFAYDERPAEAAPGLDRAEAYQFDNKNVSVQRLAGIRTYINSPNVSQIGPDAVTAVAVRAYKLSYERGPTSGRSRLAWVTECAGAAQAKCLPPTAFTYTTGGSPNFGANATFAASPLSTLKMLGAATGSYGVLTGDFNGDGRTDLLRWANNPMENQLHLSDGGGSFQLAGLFNLSSENLFKNDACYYSIVADFNGDGLSDILRVAKATCTPSANVLFLSLGNGSFNSLMLPASIDLEQIKAAYTQGPSGPCPAPFVSDVLPGATPVVPPVDRYGPAPSTGVEPTSQRSVCVTYKRSKGKRFYILDVDGDGILDFVTTVAVPYNWSNGWGSIPSETDLCLGMGWPVYSGACSRVFKGSAAGQYTEIGTNVVNSSLYRDPANAAAQTNPYWRLPDQADLDGDGLQDILSARTGRWRSNGDGNFTASQVQDDSQLCGLPIDFNGDGRSDCLRPDESPASQRLTLSYGATSSPALAQFNLTGADDKLYAVDASGRQAVGVVVEDFDGDGRQDLLRWGPGPADNGIYLSNGNGSFRSRAGAGLGSIARPLQSADGTTAFVLGDFLGTGSIQLLHLKENPSANNEASANQLYARTGVVAPMDLLDTALSPSGLLSTVSPRVPLTESGGRYSNDRGGPLAGAPPIVDLQLAMYVITSVTQETGVGSITTQYLYKGLKAERGGRGLLGFREVRQQSPAPDGTLLTVATQHLQRYPYTGVAAVKETYVAVPVDFSGPPSGSLVPLSRTTNSYCDKTSGALPTNIAVTALASPAAVPTPCATRAKVQRPYLHQSVEQGRDLNDPALALPSIATTNSYNDTGDPLAITVQTQGVALGLSQTYTKLSTNTYKPNDTAGDNWILGRLQRSTVHNIVPNSLPNIITAAGSSPYATAQVGAGRPPAGLSMPSAVLIAILQLLLDE